MQEIELNVKYGLESISVAYIKEVIEEFVRSLQSSFGKNLVSIVLFGSIARGDFSENSDIDILVIAKNFPKKFSKRIDLFIPIVEKARKKSPNYPFIQVYPLTMNEALKNRPIYLDLITDAIILYDEENFMMNILNKLFKKLKELGAKKIYLENGSWIWVLKPGMKIGEVIEI